MKTILLDLFGTVVHFKPHVPTVEVGGERWRTTMGWLQPTAEEALPDIAFDDLLAALLAVTAEMTRQRPPEYLEQPSRERFRRALARLGVVGDDAVALAERLSLVHMRHLASQVVMPAEHRAVLTTLRRGHRLGLVSNFDHGATARRILAEHGIADRFDAIVISEEVGRRKPHPAIFEAALRATDCSPDEAIFVGDSLADDVAGAHNAGLRAVWISRTETPAAPAEATPEFTIPDLPALIDLPLWDQA